MTSPFAPNSPWTDERIEELKQLWAEGLSARQIAAAMGLHSRNQIIGKLNRLKLMGRATVPPRSREGGMPRKPPEKPKEKRGDNLRVWTRQHKKVTRPKPLPPQEAFPDFSHAVSIFEHKEGMCRWPVIAAESIHDRRWCGTPVAFGEPSYCECHLWMAKYRRAA